MFKYAFVVAGLVVVFGSRVSGQTPPHYREFTLGSTLSTVSAQVKTSAADVRPIHQRPALIQDLSWRAPYFVADSNEPRKDPVQQIVFSFYNDQLFRMAIDYDRQRTEGLTDADMIGALSELYGTASTPRPRTASAVLSKIDVMSGIPVSQWGTAEYTVVLVRPTFGAGFQVVVTSTQLDELARAADAEAVRLDQSEAPLREIARRKQDTEDAHAAQEKARIANKATFRP
jgi:hypothetical protein